MQCGACAAEVPVDCLFCPECGSRTSGQSASLPPSTSTSGPEIGVPPGISVDSGPSVVTPEVSAPQGHQRLTGLPAAQGASLGSIGSGEILQGIATEMDNNAPSSAQGAGPLVGTGTFNPSNLDIRRNAATSSPNAVQSSSPTDALVDDINARDREVKGAARNAWIEMNQQSAQDVLSTIGEDLPDHLRGDRAKESAASEFLQAELVEDGKALVPNQTLLRRMAEVALRRVARKRGVAVEPPQVAIEDDDFVTVNVTYIDDGRVLDAPSDLSAAFQHSIVTEMALKGYDVSVDIGLFKSKDGSVEQVHGGASSPDEPASSPPLKKGRPGSSRRGGPPKRGGSGPPGRGRSRGGPGRGRPSGGPSGGRSPPDSGRGGGPPGPSRGGGPPGPSRGGGPSGPGGGPPGPGGGRGPPGPGGGRGPPGPGGGRGPPGGPRRP